MLHGPKATQIKARALRRTMTLPEVNLWQILRRRPADLKFRRQHPAGDYVLDFYCADRLLAIEIDGEAHNRGSRPARDAERDAWLQSRGVQVLRIAAPDVLNHPDSVVRLIVHTARSRPLLHHPSGGPPPLAGEDGNGFR